MSGAGPARIRTRMPLTVTAAVRSRMWELGIRTANELSGMAEVSYTTVRYFGFLSHDRETLERLSVALDWPPGHLPALWGGGQS